MTLTCAYRRIFIASTGVSSLLAAGAVILPSFSGGQASADGSYPGGIINKGS